MSPPPKPFQGRNRTPSGHDIPIPESVYQHMRQLDEKIDAVETRLDTKLDGIGASIQSVAAKQDASRNQTMIDLAKILVPFLVAIVGGQRLLAPAATPERIEVVHTPIDPRMAECSSLQPGTQAQTECFARVQAEIQNGKRSAP
jgi:hypothetical protein